MAERKINQDIVFAYATDNAILDLKSQLEKFFLYQTIAVFDPNFEYGNQLQNLKESVSCNFVVCHTAREFFLAQNIDFAILVNGEENGKVREYCSKNEIPYMVLLTKAVSFVTTNQNYYDKFSSKRFNLPFGILLDKSMIFDKKQFQNLAILEMSTLFFDIAQKKICNLFFSKQIDYVHLQEEQNLHGKIAEILSQKDFSIFCNFDDICNLFVTYCLTRSKDDLSILDKLTSLFLTLSKQNANRYIQTKFAYQCVMCTLESDYFANFQNSKKSTINYHIHQKYAQKNGFDVSFDAIKLPESKTNFLFEEFRPKLKSYIDEQISFLNLLKNKLADFDIDFLYSVFAFQDKQQFKDVLSLEPSLYVEPGFLQIAYGQGLLNFDL